MAKTTKLIGYGISFDMKLVGGVKTADDFARAAKSVQKSINKSTDATKQHKLQLEVLDQALKKSIVTQKQHDEARFSVEAKEIKRQQRLEKERRLVLGLDQQESLLAKNRQRRARMAGMAASGVSGLGMGGRAAGAARFLGGAAGLGAGAAGLGLGFIGASTVKESISAFAKLEAQVTAMKSLFGEEIAGKLNAEFRALAKTTILTNSQLIENAKIWASYGLTTEGMTDRLKRLGTVAGGNSEKFRALTVAFAQVNAQGKLMGQEKNQLINAGMNLQAVADAAGISMENFADAMKNGEIKAEHLNQALINITSEGGMFADYLEKQAETVSGKMTILASSWEEFMVALGETERGPASFILDKMIAATEALKEAAEFFATEPSMRGLEEHPTIRGAQVEGEQFLSTQIPGAPGMAYRESQDGRRTITGYGFGGGYAPDIVIPESDERRRQRERNKAEEYARRARLDDANEDQETLEKMAEQRSRRERQVYNRMAQNSFLTHEEYLSTMLEISDQDVRRDAEEEYRRRFSSVEAPNESFVGPMPHSRIQNRLDRQFEEDERQKNFDRDQQRKADEHNRQLEIDLLKAEQDRLDEQFREEDKAIRERERKDKQMAQVPGGASFEAGSVAEFQFLKQRETESQTAIAVKEAEDRAERQREELERRREEQMLRIEAQLEQLRQIQSGTFVGPLQDSM